MPQQARVGDTISHGGTITRGSTDIIVSGLAAARQGDSVVCHAHGNQTITSGSPIVFVNGLAAARVGDSISCGATITSGSTDTVTS
jgi:uncharacterized Zn-binding protein involved in type VI secretion